MKPQHLDYFHGRLFISRRTLLLFVPLLLWLLLWVGCGESKTPWQPDTVSPLRDQGIELPVTADLAENIDQSKPADAAADGVNDSAEAGLGDLAQIEMAAPDLTIADADPVDADLAGDMGPVALNSHCATPEPLTLINGFVSRSGSTQEAVNEFDAITCGGDLLDSMSGPQVYYQVLLEGGKQYKVTALSQSTDYDLALYGFPATTACMAADIDMGCTSPAFGGQENIYSSDKIGSAQAEVLRIAPLADQEWVIVLDSYSTNDQGPFNLTVVEIVPATNGTCAQASALSFASDLASVSGNTDGSANEFGTTITCDSGSTLGGSQVYYTLAAAANKGYRVTLNPSFFSTVYAFPSTAGCVAADVEAGCSSGGQSGTLLGSVAAGFSGTFKFVPDLPGDTLIAVDSMDPLESGAFELTVEEYAPPAHGKCLAPEPLPLTVSPLTRIDDTTGAANQFGQTVSCSTAFSLSGAQLYFSLTLEGGTTYTLEVTPTGWDAALYLFTDATCTPTEIEAQCSAAGFGVDAYTTGGKETLVLTPTDTTDYLLAVDTYSSTDAGVFELVISW